MANDRPNPAGLQTDRPSPESGKKHSLVWLKWGGGVIAGLLALLAGALWGITAWLTPERLATLISEKGSEYLDAEIQVSNMRFQIWSTFPRFWVEADSIDIRSKSLGRLPRAVSDSLPAEPERLLRVRRFRGGINLTALFGGDIKLRDVLIDELDLNLIAVNDSLANYFIFPQTPRRREDLPDISANEIQIGKGGRIRYFSLQSGLDAEIALKELDLDRMVAGNADAPGREGAVRKLHLLRLSEKKKETDYQFELSGRLNLSIAEDAILKEFPVGLQGDIGLGFDPLRLRLSDYRISLGNLQARVSLAMTGEENPELSSFTCSVDQFRLFGLLDYLPEAFIPHLEGLTSDIHLSATARLTSPYSLGSGSLPSLEVGLNVADGTIDYTLQGGETLPVRHIGLRAVLDVDGNDFAATKLLVPQFSLECRGIEGDISARITDLFGQPLVDGRWEAEGKLADLEGFIPGLEEYGIKGLFTGEGEVGFRVADAATRRLDSLKIAGSLKIPVIALAPAPGSSIDAKEMELEFNACGNMLQGVPTLTAPTRCTLRLSRGDYRNGSTSLALRDAQLDGEMSLLRSSAGFDSLTSKLTAGEIILAEPRNRLRLNSLATDISLRRATRREREGLRPSAPPQWKDAAGLADVPHTPVVLTAGEIPALARFVSEWRLQTGLKFGKARWDITHYPHSFLFGPAELETDLDRLEISRLSFRSGQSSASMSGFLTGMRRFLTDRNPSPISSRLRLRAGTIDINGIAKACQEAAGGSGGTASTKQDKEKEKGSAETALTPAWLIPRNLDAAIDLTADSVLYANLALTDASGRITVADGDLDVRRLSLATDFGSASLGLRYFSSDIETMRVAADLDLQNIRLTGFYSAFHELMKDYPSVRNLSGYVSIGGDVSLNIFPDMTVNMPSLAANLSVGGRDLQLKQNDFIHHVAEMMLIMDRTPIDIANLDIRARVYDNLLELEPFDFRFRDYELTMMGLNNFAADMMYHIGIRKSPVHIPFGINIEGNFHHPKLRFGGADWKARRSWPITGDIEKSFRWNFVREVSHYGNAFMDKAASGTAL